jgi:hypothetical protein
MQALPSALKWQVQRMRLSLEIAFLFYCAFPFSRPLDASICLNLGYPLSRVNTLIVALPQST